jgi:hypothetical protein
MTRDEFNRRFQGRMLLHLTEAWSVRKLPPSDLGMFMDDHARQLRQLLGEMYDALAPEPPPPRVNGHPQAAARAKT